MDAAGREASDAARREAADRILEDYDFGHRVVEQCGWESTTGGAQTDEWRKVLFFEDPEDPSADSVKGWISIEFAGGDVATSTTAVVDGRMVGASA